MGQHPQVIEAMVRTADAWAPGAGGHAKHRRDHLRGRVWSRHSPILHRKEAALVFSSGYVSNQTGICDHRQSYSGLPDPVPMSLNHQFDHRRRRTIGCRARDLAPQRRPITSNRLLQAGRATQPKLIAFGRDLIHGLATWRRCIASAILAER